MATSRRSTFPGFPKRRRKNGLAIAGLVLFVLAVVAAGVLGDIWLIVGGIQEFIRGVQAHPAGTHDIVFGVLRWMFAGVFTAVAVIISFLMVAAVVSA